jgi:aromatic-L-amino-acid/L-tryptophan decarboxylase
MENSRDVQDLRKRQAPIAIQPEEFRRLGHGLIDQIADFLSSLPDRPVTPGEEPGAVRSALKSADRLPENGADAGLLLERAAALLFDHSLFNSHPRFWGYVTSPAAPIGVLGELLAAAVNANVGAWVLSPMATEIEAQTVRWIAELIGYPANCGGLLVSGGNMANFVGFLAARTAKVDWELRKTGLADRGAKRLRVYASTETHTWIQKAADLSGLGTDAVGWIPADDRQRLDVTALRRQMQADRENGELPFLVVGTSGSVSTGAVDPLSDIAAVSREFGAWFHVDGAYGALAAAVPELSAEFLGLSQADSIAVDPHKWLYVPLEAGCVLVREAAALRQAFSYHPPYYHFDKDVINYFDLGPQNSRGFRALKIWLALQQVGRAGYVRMIRDDIRLAQELFRRLAESPAPSDLEPLTQGLSITTFRYVPPDLRFKRESEGVQTYLNQLNQELLARLEKSGEAFLSAAQIDGKFALRLCIVNFRTTLEDIEALPGIVTRLGLEVDRRLRPTR